MTFGIKLKQLRTQKKLSQEALGNLIDCHTKHIGKMENHGLIPYAETIKKIATLFNVSVDYLLFDNVPKNTDLTQVNDSDLVDLVFQVDNLSEEDRAAAKTLLQALVTKDKALRLFE